jgi:hypothetical protein
VFKSGFREFPLLSEAAKTGEDAMSKMKISDDLTVMDASWRVALSRLSEDPFPSLRITMS